MRKGGIFTGNMFPQPRRGALGALLLPSPTVVAAPVAPAAVSAPTGVTFSASTARNLLALMALPPLKVLPTVATVVTPTILLDRAAAADMYNRLYLPVPAAPGDVFAQRLVQTLGYDPSVSTPKRAAAVSAALSNNPVPLPGNAYTYPYAAYQTLLARYGTTAPDVLDPMAKRMMTTIGFNPWSPILSPEVQRLAWYFANNVPIPPTDPLLVAYATGMSDAKGGHAYAPPAGAAAAQYALGWQQYRGLPATAAAATTPVRFGTLMGGGSAAAVVDPNDPAAMMAAAQAECAASAGTWDPNLATCTPPGLSTSTKLLAGGALAALAAFLLL